jgi:hypothetical protein
MKILHAFADEGVESEALSAYGEVYRIGWDIKDTNESHPIQADVNDIPIKDGVTFDLGLFHPPCQKWSPGAKMNDTTDNHSNLIPLAREVAKNYCHDWIIENVPNAPLNDPLLLNGGMFGLPLHYERAFETSYDIQQPRNQTRFSKYEEFEDHHEKGDWNGNTKLWKSAKGYSRDYNSRSLKREAIPRAYINYLVRPLVQ